MTIFKWYPIPLLQQLLGLNMEYLEIFPPPLEHVLDIPFNISSPFPDLWLFNFLIYDHLKIKNLFKPQHHNDNYRIKYRTMVHCNLHQDMYIHHPYDICRAKIPLVLRIFVKNIFSSSNIIVNMTRLMTVLHIEMFFRSFMMILVEETVRLN